MDIRNQRQNRQATKNALDPLQRKCRLRSPQRPRSGSCRPRIRITSDDNYNERTGRQTRTVTVDTELGMEIRQSHRSHHQAETGPRPV